MEIYINSSRLDIYSGQDIELNFENLRFSEAIADEWSTDIELPNNENNIRILGAYGLLDRGPLFNKQVPCQLIINDIPRDGYLHVTTITREKISVACYLNTIQYSLWDKELKNYYPEDDSSSIFRWDRRTPISNNIINDICVLGYDYNSRYYSNIIAQLHPSVRAEKINQLIQTAENITLPSLNNSLYTLATKKVVCPQNRLQVFSSYMKGTAVNIGGVDIQMVGGQHITNDFKCTWEYEDSKWMSDWSDLDKLGTFKKWLKNKHQNVIKFNRSGMFTAKVYACCDRSTTITVRMYKNGVDVTNDYHSLLTTPVHQLSSSPTDLNQLLSLAVFNVPYAKDDEFSFRYHYVSSGAIAGDNVYATIIMEHSGYDITEDDYGVDLEYIGADYGVGFSYHNSHEDGEGWITGGGNGMGGNLTNYSYCYYGTWANMQSCSIRDWITGMCWVHGLKVKLDGYDLTFTSADKRKEIDGYITEIGTYNTKLGKKNIIKYKNDNLPIIFRVDNEFLDDEVSIYEAPFGTSRYRYGRAEIEQYKFTDEMTEENQYGESWVKNINVEFNNFDMMLFTAAQAGNTYQLERAPNLATFDIDELGTMTAKIETYSTDLLDVDWIYQNGRKFLVVSGSFDVNTGLYELDCIEVHTKYSGDCAKPRITSWFYPSVTDCIANYQAFDSTNNGTLVMNVYSDSAHQHLVDSYDLGYTNNGYSTIAGLTANTTYYVVFTGTNSCGTTNVEYSFTTYIDYPPQVSITDIWNINDTSCQITFEINE